MSNRQNTADDYFAGPGGWDLAAQDLGIDSRGIENSKPARATRDAAGLVTIHDDVWTFVPDGKAAGSIDSPPCPTFSQAGQGAGRKALDTVLEAIDVGAFKSLDDLRAYPVSDDDDRTRLVLTPLHFATQYDYEWLAWEQVPTVLPVWQAAQSVLAANGWHARVGLVHAEQYGTPQARTRAVLLARRDRMPAWPRATHSLFHRRDPERLDPAPLLPWVSLADALPHRDDLPAWAHTRPATTVVGTFRPDVLAAPGYRTNVSRQNAPDSVTISVAEAGVLQGFPADYPWVGGPKGGDGPKYLQAGNAIPVPLAKALLQAVTS